MKIIDKYILKKFVPMFLFLLCSVIFIMCLFDYLFNNKFSNTDITALQILYYYVLFGLFLLKLILPTIVFISTTLVVLKLSSRCEIISFLSLGISYKRFLKPFFICSIFLFKLLLIFEGWILPMSRDMMYDLERKYFGNYSVKYGYNIHIKWDEDKYLFIKNFDAKKNIGYDVFIDEIKDNKLVSRFSAKEMYWDSNDNKWIFYNCTERIYKDLQHEIENIDEISFENKNIFPEDLIFDDLFVKKLTITKLNQYFKRIKERGIDIRKVREEQLSRLQNPFLVCILIIMAVLFSSKRSRNGNKLRLMIGFIIASFFIFGTMFLEGFVKYAKTNIYVCLLGPIIIGIILNIFLYKKVQK